MFRKNALACGLLATAVGAFAITRKTPVATVWVSKTFVGGPRCVASGPASAFTPPGFEHEQEKLAKLGVKIHQSYYRDLPTCQACQICPNYRREILFEVEAVNAALSTKAGYNKTDAPENAELLEFQRSSIYRPPPDVPETD
jgi:hypothetical protein